MVSREYWKGDEKLRWASLWTDRPLSPSGHIYFFRTGVATPGKLPGKISIISFGSVAVDFVAGVGFRLFPCGFRLLGSGFRGFR